MSDIILKILDEPAGTEYENKISMYKKYFSKNVEVYPTLIEKIRQIDSDVISFQNYYIYMQWAIRKLEYSFILDHINHRKKLKIIDIGSGVTILPNILSQMGNDVDALDPSPDWKMANSKIGSLYNNFFKTDVRYNNNYISSIHDNEIYDVITCVSVLEHLPTDELKNTLNKMIDILKSGGLLIMTIDYCPRVAYSQFDVIKKIIKQKMGCSIELSHGGFSYYAFKTQIYPYLLGNTDLLELKKHDAKATSYQNFWSPHKFEGCKYLDYRPYLSLGIRTQKE